MKPYIGCGKGEPSCKAAEGLSKAAVEIVDTTVPSVSLDMFPYCTQQGALRSMNNDSRRGVLASSWTYDLNIIMNARCVP